MTRDGALRQEPVHLHLLSADIKLLHQPGSAAVTKRKPLLSRLCCLSTERVCERSGCWISAGSDGFQQAGPSVAVATAPGELTDGLRATVVVASRPALYGAVVAAARRRYQLCGCDTAALSDFLRVCANNGTTLTDERNDGTN